jgi:hypothetical protein
MTRIAVSRAADVFTACALGASLFVSTGCGGSNGSGAGGAAAAGPGASAGAGAGSATSGGVGGSFPVDAGTCSTDPLHTGLPVLFNNNSIDADDCPILEFTAKYNEPDAMVFKAIIYVESRFQYDAVGCTGNTGCCPARGWTGDECGCLGLMQTGPWCDPSNVPAGCATSNLGLLANDHIDLDTKPSSSDWGNSMFNPEVNIDVGIAGIACNRIQAKTQFPGCTEDQYTMMAVGNFNSYGSTTSCTQYNFAYDSAVVEAYKMYATAAGWPAHPYVTN